jgi:hypothetical protein
MSRKVHAVTPRPLVGVFILANYLNRTWAATRAPFHRSNDPHEEHDFGAFEVDGEKLFFKIDYYDQDLKCHSPDPSDPKVTRRVITLMLASEY